MKPVNSFYDQKSQNNDQYVFKSYNYKDIVDHKHAAKSKLQTVDHHNQSHLSQYRNTFNEQAK